MKYIEEKAQERGAFRENPTEAKTVEMYHVVNNDLIIRGDGRRNYLGRQDGQLVWTSMAKNLRAKQRLECRTLNVSS